MRSRVLFALLSTLLFSHVSASALPDPAPVPNPNPNPEHLAERAPEPQDPAVFSHSPSPPPASHKLTVSASSIQTSSGGSGKGSGESALGRLVHSKRGITLPTISPPCVDACQAIQQDIAQCQRFIWCTCQDVEILALQQCWQCALDAAGELVTEENVQQAQEVINEFSNACLASQYTLTHVLVSATGLPLPTSGVSSNPPSAALLSGSTSASGQTSSGVRRAAPPVSFSWGSVRERAGSMVVGLVGLVGVYAWLV